MGHDQGGPTVMATMILRLTVKGARTLGVGLFDNYECQKIDCKWKLVL